MVFLHYLMPYLMREVVQSETFAAQRIALPTLPTLLTLYIGGYMPYIRRFLGIMEITTLSRVGSALGAGE